MFDTLTHRWSLPPLGLGGVSYKDVPGCHRQLHICKPGWHHRAFVCVLDGPRCSISHLSPSSPPVVHGGDGIVFFFVVFFLPTGLERVQQ